MDEKEFNRKVVGVLGYVGKQRYREPGFVYDNYNEFEELKKTCNELKIETPSVLATMAFLEEEVNRSKELIEFPIRNKEEQEFYKHIVGINSYIYDTKDREENYIFDNISEVDGLLSKFESLNTIDSDIISILDYITKDIKKTIEVRQGTDKALEYQERLNNLGIVNFEQKVK